MQSFCASSIVQHHGECFVRFPLPENAIRRLFSHHKIKPTLEDGVRPGTGMKKRIDHRQRQKRQEKMKVCVKIKAGDALKCICPPNLTPLKSQGMFQYLTLRHSCLQNHTQH